MPIPGTAATSRPAGSSSGGEGDNIDLRHSQKANAGWADGHVDGIRKGDIGEWASAGKVYGCYYRLNGASLKF